MYEEILDYIKDIDIKQLTFDELYNYIRCMRLLDEINSSTFSVHFKQTQTNENEQD